MERIDNGFAVFTDYVEWSFSRWWGLALYLAASAFTYHQWGWDGIDRFTYLLNGLLVVMLLNSGRRDSLATHRKLDNIDPEPDEHLEDRDENEINRRCESG